MRTRGLQFDATTMILYGLMDYFFKQVVLIENIRTRPNYHVDFKLQNLTQTLANSPLRLYAVLRLKTD